MEGLTVLERNAIRELQQKMQDLDKDLMRSFEVMHGGYLEWTLLRFLKAREFNVPKAYQMLTDSLRWRIKEGVDTILQRDLTEDVLKRVRNGSLIAFRGYCNKGRPIFAYALGLSDFVGATVEEHVAAHIQLNEYRDRVILPEASARMGRPIVSCIKVLDTSGLKMSALSKLKIVTAIASIDDLNYPEKTDTYYIVNTPYVFSTCWKVVKNLLQERTRNKVNVLHGNGHDELLKVMDESCLPPFSTRRSSHVIDPCYTLRHPFYQAMQKFVQTRADEAKAISGCSAEVVKAEGPGADEGALNYW